MRFALCLAVFAACGLAQESAPRLSALVPRFSDYPFDRWAAAPEHSSIKWEVRLPRPQLSVHQRLIARVEVVVPGSELEKRRGRGQLILLTRIEDTDGRQWRMGSRLDLTKIQRGVKSQELTISQSAFVLPGEYKILSALIDSETMEHSFAHRKLHVLPLKPDLLPDAWRGLPPVEVLPAVDGSDGWFLPAVKNLLHLSIPKSSIPARVDLMVNITPSERSYNPAGTERRNMAVVIPALKVLSGLNAKLRPPSLAVLDLNHHRIGFESSNAATLDWPPLARLLSDVNPGIIDAKSLARQSSMRDYFASEVARRAGDSGSRRWLIVLSGSFYFDKQEEIPLPVLPPDPNRHIVYLRFSPQFGGGPRGGATPPPEIEIGPVQRVHGPMPGLGTVMPGSPGRGRGGGADTLFPDDFDRVLRPMGAQVLHVATPEAFRKVIASLLQDMSRPD